eukprot:COSAG01_NODE_803_length_13459_cov_9.995808_9_plen_87_part_00
MKAAAGHQGHARGTRMCPCGVVVNLVPSSSSDSDDSSESDSCSGVTGIGCLWEARLPLRLTASAEGVRRLAQAVASQCFVTRTDVT